MKRLLLIIALVAAFMFGLISLFGESGQSDLARCTQAALPWRTAECPW